MGIFKNDLDQCIELVQLLEMSESNTKAMIRHNKEILGTIGIATGAIAVSSYVSITYDKPEAMIIGLASLAMINSLYNLYKNRPLKGSYKIDYKNLDNIDYRALRRSQRERDFYKGKLHHQSPSKFYKEDYQEVEESFGYESDNDLPIHFLIKEEVPERLIREYELFNFKYDLPELKVSETELTTFINILEEWLKPLLQAQRIYAYSSDYFKFLYSKGLLNYWDEITIEEIISHLYFFEKDDISLEAIKELQTKLRDNLNNNKTKPLSK